MLATIERREPIEKAFARLREAPLEAAGEERILIYKNATMRLADFFPSELNPTSLYVIHDRLIFLRTLRTELLNQWGVDILQLSETLHLRTASGELVGLAPPFVEFYEETLQIVERSSDRHPPHVSMLKIPILKDGIHRAQIAMEMGVSMRCITVENALREYAPYAYPNSWQQVRLYGKTPELKKFYRRQNPYTYMRPLSVLRQTGDKSPPPQWGR